MITSRGSDTKILSKAELAARDRIMKAPDNYTSTEIASHGVTNETRGRNYDPNIFKINTAPVDPRDHSKRVDIRKIKPEVGD